MLGGINNSTWLNSEFMDKFFIENSGYASNELIEDWINYTTEFPVTNKNAKPFVLQLVKEFNQLKKDLRLPYNKKELETGVPDILKDVKIDD